MSALRTCLWIFCLLIMSLELPAQRIGFGTNQQADAKPKRSRKKLTALQRTDFLQHAKTMRKATGRAKRVERRNERKMKENAEASITPKEKRERKRASKKLKTRHLDIQEPKTRRRMKKHLRQWKRDIRRKRYRP
jgi:hypothetical protein